MRVWKVVWRVPCGDNRGELRSIAAIAPAVVYKLGVVTKAKRGCGPLAAFKTRKVAREFARNWRFNACVYKAEAKLSKRQQGLWYTLTRRDGKFKVLSPSGNLPEGTILCEEITLLERAR